MSFSNYLETEILDHVFGGNAYTAPSTIYIGLFTTAPSDSGPGTEVSGGSYVRRAVTFTVSGNLATSSAAVEWPTATADWGTVTHIGLFDASTEGNMISHSSLVVSKTISDGDVFRIPAGDLDITLD